MKRTRPNHKQRTLGLAFALAASWLPFAQADTLIVFGSVAPHRGAITIGGTSTLHDWEIAGDTIQGRLTLSRADSLAADDVLGMPMLEDALMDADTPPHIRVKIPVASLSSGKRRMDRDMANTLKAAQYATIDYALTSLKRLPVEKGDGSTLRATATGKLTISGQTREKTFPIAITHRKNGVRIEGEAALKMTDFGLEPPRMFLGALRTGDDVTVRFVWEPDRLLTP